MNLKDLELQQIKKTKTIQINNKDVVVKQYLPIQEKVDLIFKAISLAEDNNRFFNPIKLQFQLDLGIIFAYTDIEIEEDNEITQEELYDLFESNGIIDKIYINIPRAEIDQITKGANECAKAIYDYNCSILGVLEAAKNAETISEEQLQQLQSLIKDKDQFDFVRNITEMENAAGMAQSEVSQSAE